MAGPPRCQLADDLGVGTVLAVSHPGGDVTDHTGPDCPFANDPAVVLVPGCAMLLKAVNN